MSSEPAPETIIREIHERIAQASGRKGTDAPRTLALAAIRDGEAWADRRLPEMGRALDAALDALDALVRERDEAREEAQDYAGYGEILERLTRERDEARAENERLRGQRDFHDERAGILAAAVGIARLNLMEGESGKALSVLDEAAEATSKMYADARAALAAAQEPPAYTPAPECPRCGLFLAPGEVHGEHEVGCVARGPAPRDEIRHLRERLDAQTNVLGWIRDTFPDATDCWGEDVRLDSSECEPPAEGGDR